MHQPPQNSHPQGGPPNLPQGYYPQGPYPYRIPQQPRVSGLTTLALVFGIIVAVIELVAFLLDPHSGAPTSANELVGGVIAALILFFTLPIGMIGALVSLAGVIRSLRADRRKGLPHALAGLVICVGQLAWRLLPVLLR